MADTTRTAATSRPDPLRRVLIANRGEIAIRIARAAAGLGMESVSVHSVADDDSLHTRVTTDSVRLPGTDPVAAYLDIQAIVAAAVESGCDSVHPGYGFLVENAAFAAACATAGLRFVGPSPEALALFGDKVRARGLADFLGIPVVPGSSGALADADAAAGAAESIGYPVMLKASAGGGGRGIRAVGEPGELAEAFERCASEAMTAFGDGSVFLERLLWRPRHIEVQVLAGPNGNAVHLHERDCSVQLRNQKVIEIAPADGLDEVLRAKIHAEAIELVRAAECVNAATVEFLVVPETGEHYFIECNPRIQVEHTVTEMITGIDLVEAQLQIAGGATLESIGMYDQDAVGEPRGHAVQARVVAKGPGTITAYKEPSGPGVRVDAAAYVGWSPPPQFDPLLAKVVCWSRSSDVAAAVDKTRRALGEFHIGGLPCNLDELSQVLGHAAVRVGDARTTLLEEIEAIAEPVSSGRTAVPGHDAAAAIHLFDEAASRLGGPARAHGPSVSPARAGLEVGDGHETVTCPITSNLVEMRVGAGDAVRAGDALLIVSAMKMETVIAAHVSGRIAALVVAEPGEVIAADEVVAAIEPGDVDGDTALAGASAGALAQPSETWQPVLDEVAELRRLAAERLGADSEEPGVVRQRTRGKLTCRERIELLLDDGSFREVGSLAGFASSDADGNVVAFTPANHVGGTGSIDGRSVVVCADDFTSRGGHADGAIGAKSLHLDLLAVELETPSIRLLDGSSGGGSVAAMVPQQKTDGESAAKESTGAITAGRPRVSGGGGSFLPGHLGSTEYAEQLATVPVVNMLLGSVVGIGAAKAVLGHFSVMVRDIAQLFVAGPPVVSHAMGYDITKEDLGDWRIHCTNGSVDNLADSEAEAAAMTRRFLSYLPSSVHEAPPVHEPTGALTDQRVDELLTIIPRKRTTTFDVRRVIELLADEDSFFEVGGLWGTDQVTGFVRIDGHPLGVIASDSRHVNGGALTADGCRKLTRHIDLCDLFHLPVLNLVDNPGFAVGLEHEIAGTIRRGGEWMVAFAQATVPIFTVLMRRSFGVAGNNYATPRRRNNARVVWPAADVGGIPPEGGIEAAYKRQLAEADDPAALRAELNERIEAARGPVGPLNRFQMEEMVDPRDTRRLVAEWVRTAYRVAQNQTRSGSHPTRFRP